MYAQCKRDEAKSQENGLKPRGTDFGLLVRVASLFTTALVL